MGTPVEESNEKMLRRLRAEQVFYGWFDDANQSEPTYSPPLGGPCLLCGHHMLPFEDSVVTHNLMYQGQYANRSYFYRTHKKCAEKDETHTAADGFILEMIKRNGD